jgi:hypothetical protein
VPACPSLQSSVHPSFPPSICLSVCPSVCLSVCLQLHFDSPAYQAACLSLSVHPVCPSTHTGDLFPLFKVATATLAVRVALPACLSACLPSHYLPGKAARRPGGGPHGTAGVAAPHWRTSSWCSSCASPTRAHTCAAHEQQGAQRWDKDRQISSIHGRAPSSSTREQKRREHWAWIERHSLRGCTLQALPIHAAIPGTCRSPSSAAAHSAQCSSRPPKSSCPAASCLQARPVPQGPKRGVPLPPAQVGRPPTTAPCIPTENRLGTAGRRIDSSG